MSRTASRTFAWAVIGTSILLSAAPVAAGSYRYITRTGNDAVFLDEQSINRSSTSVAYWIIQAAEVPTAKYSYYLMRQTIDCARQRTRPTDMSVYNVAGNRIASDSTGGDEGNIEPGTIDHTLYMAVCRDSIDEHPLLDAASPFELVAHWRREIRRQKPRGKQH